MAYRHTADMGEISGFGGGYEACCQDMLEAGVKWLVEHMNGHEPDLKARTLKNVYGILIADSDDARALEQAILNAAKGEATGAMHQTVMQRLFFIAKNGWTAYCDELRKSEKDNGANTN